MTLLEPAEALDVIMSEFDEMPGMHLTLQQACRLWPMPDGACEALLQRLVNSGFLTRDSTHGYCRRADAGIIRHRAHATAREFGRHR